MNALIPALILLMSNAASQDRLAIGEFSDCLKKNLPCGWDKFKSISGVKLERDSLGFFVSIKSSDDVQAISRRIRFETGDFPVLKWRWKAVTFPQGAREDIKKKNDCAAGVYVAFKGTYPFNHILKYAWSTSLPVGTILPSPHGKTTMIFVIESGTAHRGEWITEKRNIRDDYQKAFGSTAPPVEGIALQSDSDNTGTSAVANYADVVAGKD
jgi:hypothetical protein